VTTAADAARSLGGAAQPAYDGEARTARREQKTASRHVATLVHPHVTALVDRYEAELVASRVKTVATDPGASGVAGSCEGSVAAPPNLQVGRRGYWGRRERTSLMRMSLVAGQSRAS